MGGRVLSPVEAPVFRHPNPNTTLYRKFQAFLSGRAMSVLASQPDSGPTVPLGTFAPDLRDINRNPSASKRGHLDSIDTELSDSSAGHTKKMRNAF